MTYAEQLEQETEEARIELSNTLDELRARMTPGQIIDQLTDKLRDGAPAEFVSNLKNQAVNNPLPIAIMGVSLAWMMLGSRNGSGKGVVQRATDKISEAATGITEGVRSIAERTGRATAEKRSEWTDRMVDATNAASAGSTEGGKEAKTNGKGDGSWIDSAGQSATRLAADGREAVESLTGDARRAASDTYEGITETGRRTAAMISESTKATGRRTVQTGKSALEFCREQPLLTTAFGVALGMLLGALAPPTELENSVLGDTADQMKGDIKDLASEQYSSAKKAGEHAFETSEKTDADGGGKDSGLVMSDDEYSNQRDEVTLAPGEPPATGESSEQPPNSDHAPAQKT